MEDNSRLSTCFFLVIDNDPKLSVKRDDACNRFVVGLRDWSPTPFAVSLLSPNVPGGHT